MIMKKILLTLAALLTLSMSVSAMSYEQARREALFLTDKMAYELNLNERQYDAAYEINLDYLMGVTGVNNVYGTYWTRRNQDMRYILLDWQWSAYVAATYFYRPLYWSLGNWHFGIYSRYPHRHILYFNHPTVYVSYRGGHGWNHYRNSSYYHINRSKYHSTVAHNGLRDRHDRGEFRNNRASTTSVTNHTNAADNRRSSGTFSTSSNGSNSRGAFGSRNESNVNRNTTSTNANSRNNSSVSGSNNSSSRNNSSVRSTGSATSRTSSVAGNRSSSTSRNSSTGSRSTNSSNNSSFGGKR